MSFYEYTDTYDRKIVKALLDKVLSDGYKISVFDGEEWTVKISTDKKEIIGALATTGEDCLKIRDENKSFIGSLYFIYCNGNDGRDVLCDYSFTPETEKYMNELGEISYNIN